MLRDPPTPQSPFLPPVLQIPADTSGFSNLASLTTSSWDAVKRHGKILSFYMFISYQLCIPKLAFFYPGLIKLADILMFSCHVNVEGG